MDLIPLIYVEIDTKYCANTFGVAPCTATGTKCFNTRNNSYDCQDIPNFNPTTKTYRHTKDSGYYRADYPAICNLEDLDIKDGRIDPGESIGESATGSMVFKNHLHSDFGIDKYAADRGYDTYNTGTYWGKWRARNPFIEGNNMRVLKGFVGMDIEDFEVMHFVILSMSGPDGNGVTSFKFTDFMRKLSAKKAQAPAVSKGYLSADITNSATSFTIAPTGIGSEYPSSGFIGIGEEEIPYTRSGDVFTITRGPDAKEHKAEDSVQWILVYDSKTAAYISNDLITNYSPLDSSFTNLTLWESTCATYSDVLFSRKIPKPTPVETLLNELIQQAKLIMFGDYRTNKIIFDVLRPGASTGQVLKKSNILSDSFKQTDQPNKRASVVWVYYNQKNIFKSVTDVNNYYSVYINPAFENNYEEESIKKVFAAWIPEGGQSVAQDISGRMLARQVVPPLLFSVSILINELPPVLGEVRKLEMPQIEGAFGTGEQTEAIVTGIIPEDEGWTIIAEQLTFDDRYSSAARVITIDLDCFNVNLRDLYDAIYSTVDTVNPITFIVNTGVVVGSLSTALYAMDQGDWPVGVEPILNNFGFVVGRGGSGGPRASDGFDGGPALKVRSAMTIDNTDGVIGGGGGGGGAAMLPWTIEQDEISNEGAAGAGYARDTGATLELGADSGSYGGDGGNLGVDGADGTNPGGWDTWAGGLAGVAVDGDSLITWTALGDIRGAQIG